MDKDYTPTPWRANAFPRQSRHMRDTPMISYGASVQRERAIKRMKKAAIAAELRQRGVEGQFKTWDKPTLVSALLNLDFPWVSWEALWDSGAGSLTIIEVRGRGASREVIAQAAFVITPANADRTVRTLGFLTPEWIETGSSPLGYRPGTKPVYTADLKKAA